MPRGKKTLDTYGGMGKKLTPSGKSSSKGFKAAGLVTTTPRSKVPFNLDGGQVDANGNLVKSSVGGVLGGKRKPVKTIRQGNAAPVKSRKGW